MNFVSVENPSGKPFGRLSSYLLTDAEIDLNGRSVPCMFTPDQVAKAAMRAARAPDQIPPRPSAWQRLRTYLSRRDQPALIVNVTVKASQQQDINQHPDLWTDEELTEMKMRGLKALEINKLRSRVIHSMADNKEAQLDKIEESNPKFLSGA